MKASNFIIKRLYFITTSLFCLMSCLGKHIDEIFSSSMSATVNPENCRFSSNLILNFIYCKNGKLIAQKTDDLKEMK